MNGLLNLAKDCKVTLLSGAVAAGTDGSRQTLTEIDTLGYGACAVILLVGTVTSTGTITLRAKNSATSATYGSGTVGDIGSAIGLTSSMPLILDVIEPLNRYLRFDYERLTANVVILGAIAVLYNPGSPGSPVTQAAGVVTTTVANPTPSAT